MHQSFKNLERARSEAAAVIAEGRPGEIALAVASLTNARRAARAAALREGSAHLVASLDADAELFDVLVVRWLPMRGGGRA